MKPLYVVNSKGEKESFSFQKVYKSAKRAGTSGVIAKRIAREIERRAYPGIRTLEIFKRVKKLLKKEAPKPALKFSLKEAMRKLGPTGFQFEKYIAEIFSQKGFRVRINQRISGFCCKQYEIDFTARKKNLLYIAECKYRNLPGGKVDLDIALSNHARFLDIKKEYSCYKKTKNLKIKSILITNAKFTTKAIKYSRCAGVELLGWGYPKKEGLEYLIEHQKMYPITILPSFKKNMADIFAQERMMLAQDVLKISPERLYRKTGISKKQIISLRKEAETLLGE